MNLKTLTKTLEQTPHFKTLKTKHPLTYLTAAFLIIDTQNPKQTQIQLDYFLPETSQIAAFSHPFQEPPKIHDNLISVQDNKTTPEKIKNQFQPQTLNINPDIENLNKKIKIHLEKNNINLNPTKIIAILKDNTWNLTCMDNTLGMARLKIDTKTGETQKSEKGSLMDLMGFKKR